MFKAIPPKFQKNITSEKEQKIERSIKESENITFRQVFCCFCESYLFDVGDDLCGHIGTPSAPNCSGSCCSNSTPTSLFGEFLSR